MTKKHFLTTKNLTLIITLSAVSMMAAKANAEIYNQASPAVELNYDVILGLKNTPDFYIPALPEPKKEPIKTIAAQPVIKKIVPEVKEEEVKKAEIIPAPAKIEKSNIDNQNKFGEKNKVSEVSEVSNENTNKWDSLKSIFTKSENIENNDNIKNIPVIKDSKKSQENAPIAPASSDTILEKNNKLKISETKVKENIKSNSNLSTPKIEEKKTENKKSGSFFDKLFSNSNNSDESNKTPKIEKKEVKEVVDKVELNKKTDVLKENNIEAKTPIKADQPKTESIKPIITKDENLAKLDKKIITKPQEIIKPKEKKIVESNDNREKGFFAKIFGSSEKKDQKEIKKAIKITDDKIVVNKDLNLANKEGSLTTDNKKTSVPSIFSDNKDSSFVVLDDKNLNKKSVANIKANTDNKPAEKINTPENIAEKSLTDFNKDLKVVYNTDEVRRKPSEQPEKAKKQATILTKQAPSFNPVPANENSRPSQNSEEVMAKNPNDRSVAEIPLKTIEKKTSPEPVTAKVADLPAQLPNPKKTNDNEDTIENWLGNKNQPQSKNYREDVSIATNNINTSLLAAAPVGSNIDNKKIMLESTKNKKLLINIQFNKKQIELTNDNQDVIKQMVIEHLNDKIKFKIISYATSIKDQTNSDKRIALQRAMNVRALMLNAGLSGDRVSVQALGEEKDAKDLLEISTID